MPYNEQETCFVLIARVLWDKGYNSHQRILALAFMQVGPDT